MAITIAKRRWINLGSVNACIANITLDASYPTNGYTAALGFSPGAFALRSILAVHPVGCNGAASLVVQLIYDYTNIKLLCARSNSAAHTHNLYLKNADVADSAGARVNAGADLLGANTGASLTVTGLAAGATTHGGVQGIAAAQAALVEVTNATDLSAVTVRVMVIGGDLP